MTAKAVRKIVPWKPNTDQKILILEKLRLKIDIENPKQTRTKELMEVTLYWSKQENGYRKIRPVLY